LTSTRVLYITYDGLTDPLGQSQVIPYLQGLAKAGYTIYILSYEKPALYDKRKEKISAILKQSGINWIPIRYHKNPPVLSSIYDALLGIFLAFKICFGKNIQIIHCRGNYMTSLMAYPILSIKKLKYIFDMRGFWINEQVDGGLINLSSLKGKMIYRFFKGMERRFLKRADYIVTLTWAAKTYIEQNFATKGKIETIPCCADLTLFKVQSAEVRKAFRDKLGIKDEFVWVYLGSIGTWYMLDEMVAFYKAVSEKKGNMKFLFISNEMASVINDSFARNGLTLADLIVVNSEREDVPKYLSAADASVFFIKPLFSKKGSSPVKHAEVLASHLPLICNSHVGDLKEFIEESNTGVIINTFSRDEYISTYDKLTDLIKSGKMNFELPLQKYYDLDKGIEKYRNIYAELTANNT
jgi:glycosyltransferase involved in cell wall biosynthesis